MIISEPSLEYEEQPEVTQRNVENMECGGCRWLELDFSATIAALC